MGESSEVQNPDIKGHHLIGESSEVQNPDIKAIT